MNSILTQKFAHEQILEVRYIVDPAMLEVFQAREPHHILSAEQYHESMKDPDTKLGQFKFIRGHLVRKPPPFKEHRTTYLTMLRNPISRMYSSYLHIVQRNDNFLYKNVKDFSYDQFMTYEPAIQTLDNTMTTFILGRQAKTQADLEEACENLDNMTFVGITEQFDASLLLMHYTYSWPYEFESAFLNTAKAKKEQQPLSDEASENLQRLIQYDLQLYDYGVTVFNQRMHQMALELYKLQHEKSEPEPVAEPETTADRILNFMTRMLKGQREAGS